MNPHSSRLRQEEKQAEEHSLSKREANAAPLDSPEELLRWDKQRNPPPESIQERIKQSAAREPQPKRSWLHRLFNKP